MIRFSISKNDIEQAKFKIRAKIDSGVSIDDAIAHGVKYIQKLVNKRLPKHVSTLLKHFHQKFSIDFKINNEHLIDQMKLLNIKANK